MLILAGEAAHLLYLGRGDIPRINAAHAHTFAMHLQHDLRRLFAAQTEKRLQHDDHEFHRRIVVIQQHYLEQRRRLDLGLFRLKDGAFTRSVRHAYPLTQTLCQILRSVNLPWTIARGAEFRLPPYYRPKTLAA